MQVNYPILIIQTYHTTVVYIQGEKYLQQQEIHPLQWITLGMIALRMGIQDIYSNHIKKVYICENDVNVGIDLKQFSDRVDNLPLEILNVVQGICNEVVVGNVDVKSE